MAQHLSVWVLTDRAHHCDVWARCCSSRLPCWGAVAESRVAPSGEVNPEARFLLRSLWLGFGDALRLYRSSEHTEVDVVYVIIWVLFLMQEKSQHYYLQPWPSVHRPALCLLCSLCCGQQAGSCSSAALEAELDISVCSRRQNHAALEMQFCFFFFKTRSLALGGKLQGGITSTCCTAISHFSVNVA